MVGCSLTGVDHYEEYEGYFDESGEDDRPPDPVEGKAVDALRAFFDANRERVYSSRQV